MMMMMLMTPTSTAHRPFILYGGVRSPQTRDGYATWQLETETRRLYSSRDVIETLKYKFYWLQ